MYGFFTLILSLGTSYGDVNNILTNPGFESGTTGWAARGSGVSISSGSSSPSPHSGSYRGRATGRTATWHGIEQNVLNKMVIGATYTVSGWLRTSTTASSTVHLSFEKIDGSGTTYAWGASGTASSSGWVYISGSYTLTVNGTLTGLKVYAEGPNSGIDIYLDDVNVFGQVPGVPDSNATGLVNFAVTHQTLDGFGAAGAWYEGDVVNNRLKSTLYNVLFGDLGLDIYRVRNAYNEDGGTDYINNSAEIVAAGEASLGHPLRVMIASWSPPDYLKSNNDTVRGTLKKDGSGNYMYADFAQWWADSLDAWSNAGVDAYYITMQNEPGWVADWDTCLFDPTENTTNAGYQQAFAAFYTNLNTMPNRPKLLAPEGQNVSGTGSYIDALTTTDKSNVYGYSHHLYDGNVDAPDGLNAAIANLASQYGDRPLLQTEFSKGTSVTLTFATDAMNLAIWIHNLMTIENASAYLYWELFWGSPKGLVSVSTTGYTINPVYYAMKHYSKFTDPNWQRVDANTISSNLRISAYKDPCEPNAAIVIINTSTTTDINLTLALNGFTPQNSGIYQSKSDANFAYIGTFSTSTPVLLPKQSITTIHLAGFADCAAVQAGGYRLDSDLNGDCYVDYLDLEIIAYYWLHTDCIAPGNCQNADFAPTDGVVDFFDFSDFGPQWSQCNDPRDPDCTPNW